MNDVKIWGDALEEIADIKAYKGKFVIREGQFLAKLFPKAEWDGSVFFHNMILEELGVEDAQSQAVMETVAGGGKIEVELFDEHLECRLYGKSTIYGPYNADDVDTSQIEEALEAVFHLGIPISVIPSFQE